MKNKNILTILFLMLILTVISCGNSNKKSDRIDAVEKEVVKAPEFNADSAYAYVGAQADFGPRVPNTKAHEECGEYLAQQLEKFGAFTSTVISPPLVATSILSAVTVKASFCFCVTVIFFCTVPTLKIRVAFRSL